MTTLYGIKNCDTIKKARQWLETHDIPYTFHDYRADGLDRGWLQLAESHVGWELMLNKRGTTFRQLPEEEKQDLSKDKALDLLMKYPAMIKRPLLVHEEHYQLGFKEQHYQEIFK